MHTHTYSVCQNCKLIYGHPLLWCPSCPAQMQKLPLNSLEVQALLDQKWKGDEVSEYIFNKKIYKSNCTYELEKDYLSSLDLKLEIDHKKLKYRYEHYKRCLYPYYEDDQNFRIEFKKPIYYRRQDSNIWHEWWNQNDRP